jgi:hypothetical protein
MKRIILISCTLVLIFGIVGSVSALSFVEQYQGDQAVYEGDAYNFGFDFWYDNDVYNIGTNSSLNLTSDAAGATDPWDSASLAIDFYSEDSDSETARITFFAWGAGTWYNLGYLDNFLFGISRYTFNYTFNQTQLTAFETEGWGNVRIRAVTEYDGNFNDFGITRVAMTVNTSDLAANAANTSNSVAPVPEPSTILLMGVGLLGLVAVGRRKFNPEP